MNTYIVDSWVSSPALVEAYNEEHAKNIYANTKGYVDWQTMVDSIGLTSIPIDVEEISRDEDKYSESGAVEVRTH